jgi:hypothetical protein
MKRSLKVCGGFSERFSMVKMGSLLSVPEIKISLR